MKKALTSILASAILSLSATASFALDEITVAYFLEWPLPMLASKADGTFEKELGLKIDWKAFETGTAMSAAMASGDVQIAVSQGLPPFVVAASAGQDLQVVSIAVSYSENDNCVVKTGVEIDKTNAGELAGKTVAVPLGTAAHYGFLRQMGHFKVDVGSLKVINMPPPEGAAALQNGDVEMACGYGGGLTRMKEHGSVLLTGKEKEELGILVFDVVSAPSTFVAEQPEILSKFLSIAAAADDKWNSTKDEAMLTVMAKESGMDLEAAKGAIATMEFPSREEQLSEKWLGGGVQSFMKGVANVFVEAKSIDKALDDYTTNVNAEPLTDAQ